MTNDEIEAMSAEFDREFIADTFGPIPAGVKARLERARRKRGRPRVGAGAKAISVTIEKTLLRRVDRIAKLRETTRARLIASGLQTVVAYEESITQEASSSAPSVHKKPAEIFWGDNS